MGLISKLFGDSSQLGVAKKLEDMFVPFFQGMGMPLSEAKREFKDMFKQVKEYSIKQGTINLPDNYGDILIEKEATDEKIKANLAKIRKEGVTDEDIRWWWNRHDLERGMIHYFDFVNAYAQFKSRMEEDKLDAQEAADWTRKYYPLYGDPSDISRFTGDDRPLPHELGNRVNIYLEKRVEEKALFKRELETSSSFNALVRKKIKEGNL